MLAELSFDARRRKDPTGTHYVRARMRAEGDRRWQALARTLRQALIEHDLVGIRGIGRLPHGDKTTGFATWLRAELQHKVFGYNGSWVRPYVQRSADVAQRRAHTLAAHGPVDPHRVAAMESLAVSELRGVIEAAQQQITRAVTHCLMANATPTATANTAARVVKVMRNRTRAMSEYIVAKTHAAATLSVYRSSGITHVGIEPERIRRTRTHDAKWDPELDEVDVLTAEDEDVCIVCEEISDDGPYELDEAEDLIPAHPWCRCAFVPAGTVTGDAQALGALTSQTSSAERIHDAPEAAGVLFRTRSGHMLLMKRADTGEWSIPAGHLEANETPLHAAQREAAEETGWPGNSRAYRVHTATTRGVKFHTFVQPSEWQFKPILNPEHTQHGWYKPSRLPAPLHPGLVATLHAMSEGGAIPYDAVPQLSWDAEQWLYQQFGWVRDDEPGHPFRGNQYTGGISGPSKLEIGETEKVGEQLGTNKGGVYVNKAGEKFYVKEPKGEAQVTNEKVAAALYKLAGANTLEYVDAGPKHIATKWVDLEKDNASKLTPNERVEAQKDFAVHAWLANWDAAGLVGDNVGVVNGKVTTLDVGGALEYRAQGTPKGAAFGNQVTELDTLRDPTKNHAAAQLYGDMTHEQIKESLAKLNLSSNQIYNTVKEAGGSHELAEKLIQRQVDLYSRVNNEKYQIPPVKEPLEKPIEKVEFKAPEEKPTEVAKPVEKPSYGDTPEHIAAVNKWLGGPLKTGQDELKGLKDLAEKTKDPELKGKVLDKLVASYAQKQENYKAAGKTDKVKDVQKKLDQLKVQKEWLVKYPPKPISGEAPKPTAPAPAPAAAPAVVTPSTAHEPTQSELTKAAKGTAVGPSTLGLQPPASSASGAPAHQLVKAFNEKWQGKTITDPSELKQKVQEYKSLQETITHANTNWAGEKAQFEAAEKVAAKEKAEKEKAKYAEQHAEVARALGISDPHELQAFDSFIEHFGGTKNALAKFKDWEQTASNAAKAHPGLGYEKLSGFEMGSIKAYTGPQSSWINQAIINDKMTPAQYMFENVLNKALDKLPKVTGERMRGLTLNPDVQGKLEPGYVWTHRNFASSSAQGWSGNTRLHITATGKGGADVRFVSSHPGEGETLFKSNLKLLITKREQKSDALHIWATEM